MNVHDIGIDHPDFKPAVMELIRRYDGFKLKRLTGQFDAYRHCFNGDVTLEMLQQSKTVSVEDMRKALRASDDKNPTELKLRLDNNCRIAVPVDGDLKISLSEKSFMLITKTGVILGRKAKVVVEKPAPDSDELHDRAWRRRQKNWRYGRKARNKERFKAAMHLAALCRETIGVTVVSAERSEDREGYECIVLTLSNGKFANLYS
jgi:hypothetical protein